MAANALEQSLLQAGGMLNGHPSQEKICQAFRIAAERACKKLPNGKYPKKQFNDFFYEALGEMGDSNVVDAAAREAPVLLQAGEVATSAAAGTVLTAVEAAGSGVIGVGGSAWPMLEEFLTNPSRAGLNIRFLDGKLADGTVLELKGPGDKFHGNQAKDLVAANGGDQPATAACKACKADCNNKGGGRARGCKS